MLPFEQKQLLDRVATGDQEAFAVLFNEFHPKIYAAGRKLTRSGELAEELVQEVFMKLWLRRESLAAIENLEAYLYTLGRNQMITILKKSAARKTIMREMAATAPLHTGDNPEQQLTDKYYRVLLEQAVSQLSPRQQEIYRLAKQDGLKRGEIAAQLGMSGETVKEHLRRAVNNIRKYLQDHGDALPPGTLLVISLWLQIRR